MGDLKQLEAFYVKLTSDRCKWDFKFAEYVSFFYGLGKLDETLYSNLVDKWESRHNTINDQKRLYYVLDKMTGVMNFICHDELMGFINDYAVKTVWGGEYYTDLINYVLKIKGYPSVSKSFAESIVRPASAVSNSVFAVLSALNCIFSTDLTLQDRLKAYVDRNPYINCYSEFFMINGIYSNKRLPKDMFDRDRFIIRPLDKIYPPVTKRELNYLHFCYKKLHNWYAFKKRQYDADLSDILDFINWVLARFGHEPLSELPSRFSNGYFIEPCIVQHIINDDDVRKSEHNLYSEFRPYYGIEAMDRPATGGVVEKSGYKYTRDGIEISEEEFMRNKPPYSNLTNIDYALKVINDTFEHPIRAPQVPFPKELF